MSFLTVILTLFENILQFHLLAHQKIIYINTRETGSCKDYIGDCTRWAMNGIIKWKWRNCLCKKYDPTAVLLDILMDPGWTMKRYRSTAIKRVEKEERNTKVAWGSKYTNNDLINMLISISIILILICK